MIRRATEDDKMGFSFLANQFVKESKYPFRVDWELLLSNFLLAIKNPDFCVLVLEKEGQLVGMLVGGVAQPLFSKDRVATELAWFIEKPFRNAKDSLKMLKLYEEWAGDRECRFVTMIDIETLQDLTNLYERKGYKLIEKTFVKEV